MRYRKIGGNSVSVELLPGRPTIFVTVWLWRLRVQAMWRAV